MLESLFGAAGKALKLLFTWDEKSFPPCNAKVLREHRGWPWSRQVVIHTRLDGKITQRLVAPDDANFPEAPPSPRALPPEKPRPKIGY